MKSPSLILDNEAARLNALRDLNLLDTPPSESFDRLTRMASRLFNAPVSTISLTDGDRQWFKSKVGVGLDEIPREQAPCSYAIQRDEVFVVADLLEDQRFQGSPLAQAGIRFYAGAPLITRAGYGLGTICVVDDKPRQITPDERLILCDLAGMVMTQVEIQNMIGHVDATSGLANEHQLFEDLSSLVSAAANQNRTGLLVELVSAEQASQGLRVLGASYTEEIVRQSTARIRQAVPAETRLYQVGPCRFLLVWDEDRGPTADAMISVLTSALAEPVTCNGIPVILDPAMGIHRFVVGEGTCRDVLRCLFNAAADARKAVGGRATYNEKQDQAHSRSFSILHDVPQALESLGQLSLVYQPRVDLATGWCIGAEALLRWKHPTLGPVPPDQFIPLVEQTALMHDMTDWVVEAAIAQVARWRRQPFTPRISINASVLNLEELDFTNRLADKLKRHGVPADAIELEFTEGALTRDGEQMLAQMNALRRMGIALAIDDFGTGYSNLSYLQQLPMQVLKIDRSFLRKITTDQRDRKLVQTMIAMAHDLGFRVVAEGVEDRQCYDLLAQWNCDEAQGYFIARPMPAADFETWLAASSVGAAPHSLLLAS